MKTKQKRAVSRKKRPAAGRNGEPKAEQNGELRAKVLARIYRIHDLVLAGNYPNKGILARELGVSQKCVERALEAMRCEFKLPLEYEPRKYGFYYTEPVKHFPGAPALSERELFALLIAHKAVEQYRGTPFHEPLQVAYKKLSGQLDNRERYTLHNLGEALSFRPFAPEDADLKTFEILTRGMREKLAVRYRYRKPEQDRPEVRLVHPYHLFCGDGRWYLFAHDTARKAIRTFAVCRVTEPRLMSQHFVKSASFDPKQYLATCFNVMKGDGDYEVVIEFDRWGADQLVGRQWHATQTMEKLPKGGCRLRMRLSGLEEVERWVLSWGTHAHVVRPVSLAERIRKVSLVVAARYEGTPEAPAGPPPGQGALKGVGQ